MKEHLYRYLVTPMVLRVQQPTPMTVRPMDVLWQFDPARSYTVTLKPMTRRTRQSNLEAEDPQDPFYLRCVADGQYDPALMPQWIQSYAATVQDGCLHFTAVCDNEEEYRIIVRDDAGKTYPSLRIYALRDDLYAKRPLKGDLHVHSCRSDGREAPAVVAANYRMAGFDFTVISDHGRYYPSREAQQAYEGVPLGMLIVNGEEVHAPENYVHIIHFGGRHSVNELFQNDPDRYFQEVSEIARNEEIPYYDKFLYAANLWCIRRIREAGGLAVFCHPQWVYHDQQNDPDELARLFLARGEFDAFELIGGQVSQENDLQVAFWNDLRAEGHRIPVVGSSDSHGTLEHGLYDQMYTIVFADEFSVDGIIRAVKQGNSTAVEFRKKQGPIDYYYTDGDEYSVHASYRLVAYTRFLIDEYFARTRIMAAQEGSLMRDYLFGVPTAKQHLADLRHRLDDFYSLAFGR